MSWWSGSSGSWGGSAAGGLGRLRSYFGGGEADYLESLGQQVPEGVEVLGPSSTFMSDPAYHPGGSAGGIGGLSSMLGRGTQRENDPVGDAVLAPKRRERATLLEILPYAANIGAAIGPVARSEGGHAMARAMRGELAGRQDAEVLGARSSIGRDLRKINAAGDVAESSVAIVRQIISILGGGGPSGGAGGAGGAAGGFGSFAR
jgi:hypothetical protein